MAWQIPAGYGSIQPSTPSFLETYMAIKQDKRRQQLVDLQGQQQAQDAKYQDASVDLRRKEYERGVANDQASSDQAAQERAVKWLAGAYQQDPTNPQGVIKAGLQMGFISEDEAPELLKNWDAAGHGAMAMMGIHPEQAELVQTPGPNGPVWGRKVEGQAVYEKPEAPKDMRTPEQKDAAALKLAEEKQAIKDRAKKANTAPKYKAAIKADDVKIERVLGTIEKAIKLAGGKRGEAGELNADNPNMMTTGWGGLLKNLPSSDAKTLDGYLTTIKANIGFDALAQMRLNSPTGGALGNVSDRENALLQAINGALDQAADGSITMQNLEEIRKSMVELRELRESAYRNEFESEDASSGPQDVNDDEYEDMKRRLL